MRVIGFGFRRPKNPVPGIDVAGTVVAVGSAVTRFAVGDEVFGMSRGSFAEYAAAREDKLAHQAGEPHLRAGRGGADLGGHRAPGASSTAGRLEAGQKVLVIGASGGVGSYAVQLAKALGAEVTGVASTAKLDLVRSLGADHVLDYTQDDFADGTRRYDLILDIGGNPPLSRLRRALTPTGTAVIVGGEEGGNCDRRLRPQPAGSAACPCSCASGWRCSPPRSAAATSSGSPSYIEAGTVTPSIDRTYPLDRGAGRHASPRGRRTCAARSPSRSPPKKDAHDHADHDH